MALNATTLKDILDIRVNHALYREDGRWYHHLREFPGALFDKNGLIIFQTETDYQNTEGLQNRQELHIVGGIEGLPGYRLFTPAERQKIDDYKQKKIIDEHSSWDIFQRRAQEYFEKEEVMVSPGQGRRYIIDRIHPSIRIKRLDVNGEESAEVMGHQRFDTCIRRINRQLFPIPNGGVYQHRAEEVALVTLLPMLDWSEDGHFIVYDDEEMIPDVPVYTAPEAPDDNIGLRIQVWLRKRQGQKKLRDKLFEEYAGCCAISNCDIRAVLHACHVIPFAQTGSNISTNAILLRSDIHDLFDANVLAIHPETHAVHLHPTIQAHYAGLNEVIKTRLDKKLLDPKGLWQRWALFTAQP